MPPRETDGVGVTNPKRLSALAGAVLVTLLTCAGALGVGPGAALRQTSGPSTAPTPARSAGGTTSAPTPSGSRGGNWLTIEKKPATTPTATTQTTTATAPTESPTTGQSSIDANTPALPPNSGSGRRVVYDISAQRVWLVGGNGTVQRSYLVSGGTDKQLLHAGRYSVYSMSRHASSNDGKETMNYMVAFEHGGRYAVGFHDIPARPSGTLVESQRELGTFQSASGISQWITDAKALWEFAKVGMSVVVTT